MGVSWCTFTFFLLAMFFQAYSFTHMLYYLNPNSSQCGVSALCGRIPCDIAAETDSGP